MLGVIRLLQSLPLTVGGESSTLINEVLSILCFTPIPNSFPYVVRNFGIPKQSILSRYNLGMAFWNSDIHRKVRLVFVYSCIGNIWMVGHTTV